jgi:hypothetical protein
LTGASGVIYPAALLPALKAAGTHFEKCCPRGDDIWLHAQALRAGFRVRQIKRRAVLFFLIPGTQESALFNENMFNGNDPQIARTYTKNDLDLIAESWHKEGC